MPVLSEKARPAELIGAAEVLTSSELLARLTEHGYRPEAARQVISRAAKKGQGLWRSSRLRLERGERLFARANFYGTSKFYELAAHRLQKTRPGLARCLDGLAGNGVLNRVHAQRLLAAAVVQNDNSRSPGYDAELSALSELGVRVAGRGTAHEYLLGGNCSPSEVTDQLATESLLALRRECLLARMLVSRLRKQNVVSWNGNELPRREKGCVVLGNQVFTAYGYSFLAPLIHVDEKKVRRPCYVLIDMFAGVCTVAAVWSFLARAKKATSWGKKRSPYLGLIAARDFETAAWNEARSAGLLTVNLLQMFGDEALNAMVIVERILGGLRADATKDTAREFAEFTDAIEGLKSNPVVDDLRSIGFEVLAGLVLQGDGWHDIILGQDVPFGEDRTRDVDVLGRRGNDLIMVECKAHHERKELSREEVHYFFTQTVPACRAWWAKKEKRPVQQCYAEIWTSGPIGEEAQKALDELALRTDTKAAILGRKQILDRVDWSLRKKAEGLLKAIAEKPKEEGK